VLDLQGFGPFRWICTSGSAEDLRKTDKIAETILVECQQGAPLAVRQQLDDNLLWIRRAEENQLVVGSQARILYADCRARTRIALAFNEAIRSGHISAPVVLSRDHHDVSGTDSPFRETSNVSRCEQAAARDGMAVTRVARRSDARGSAHALSLFSFFFCFFLSCNCFLAVVCACLCLCVCVCLFVFRCTTAATSARTWRLLPRISPFRVM